MMLPVCYFVTSNKGKVDALLRLIPTLKQVDYDLVELQELDPHVIITAKLTEAMRELPELVSETSVCIVEDTSLYFDALKHSVSGAQELPGPFIKWFLATLGPEGLYELAAKQGNVRAQATTVIGCMRTNGQLFFVEGSVNGTIVKPRGTMGFGWASIFQPDGCDKTFGEMSMEERELVSMRTIAAEKLKNKLLHD
jgi:non-canonical purine NTP pyrophosphatase (RdgB/HAM1 family)